MRAMLVNFAGGNSRGSDYVNRLCAFCGPKASTLKEECRTRSGYNTLPCHPRKASTEVEIFGSNPEMERNPEMQNFIPWC